MAEEIADETIAGFDNVIVALLRDDGQLKRLHESVAQIDICEEHCEVVAKVIKGSRVICSIKLAGSEASTARIQKRSLALSIDDETYFIRFHTSKDVESFLETLRVTQSKRVKSIFSQRTEKTSAEQYFQFYGYLSQQQNMMQDYVRTSTYQRAMLENVADFQNKVVLDVGAGSGILSFFAIQAGAKRVYAVEASSMSSHCEALVAANMMMDQIVVISGKIEEVDIPEMVDIIISEPMGYMLFNERMLETYLHAKKWLKPGGKMFPSQGDLLISPFTDDALYLEQFSKANFWHQPSFHGVDLTGLREQAVKEYFKQPIVDTFDVRICMAKTHKYTVDFETAEEADLQDIDIPVTFTMQQSGSVHGLAFWFDVAFIGSQTTVWLSTAPTQPLTHWYQVRCLLSKPLFVRTGQTLSGNVRLRSNKRQSYDVDMELYIEGVNVKHTNTLDLKNPCFRYTGQPVQPPPGSNHISPSDAYWNQQDATTGESFTASTLLTPGAQCDSMNGDTAQYIIQQQQQQPGSAAYNNFMSAANLMANIAGINSGSIPAAGVGNQIVNLGGSPQAIEAATLISGGVSCNKDTVAARTQLNLTNHLMIGDYVVPNNIILPPAHGAVSMPPYKTVTELQ